MCQFPPGAANTRSQSASQNWCVSPIPAISGCGDIRALDHLSPLQGSIPDQSERRPPLRSSLRYYLAALQAWVKREDHLLHKYSNILELW